MAFVLDSPMLADEARKLLGCGLVAGQAGEAVRDLLGQPVTRWSKTSRRMRNICAAPGKSTPSAGATQIARRTILPLLRSISTWCSLPGATAGRAALIWASRLG